MNTWTTGVLIALVLAGGLWLMLSAVRAVGAPSFADRIAPQLRMVQVSSALNRRGVVRASRTAGNDRVGPVLQQALTWATDKITPFAGSASVLERRLIRAGLDKSVVDYRAEQVVFAVLGVLIGSVFSIGLILRGDVSVAIVMVGAVLGAFCGVWGRDFLLKQRIAKREKLMLAEFPAVAELMALSVGAGRAPSEPWNECAVLPKASLSTSSGKSWHRPAQDRGWSRRSRIFPPVPTSFRWDGSWTASSWPSNGEHRWPRSCALKPRTSAITISAS